MATTVTTEELQSALEELAQQMGVSVREYVLSLGYATVEDVQKDLDSIRSQISAITEMDDNGVESLAEKLAKLQELLNNDEGVVQGLIDQINVNSNSIEEANASIKTLQDALAANGVKIDGLTSDLSELKTTVTELDKKVSDRFVKVESNINELQSSIEVLNGDASVEGSVSKQIADEANRTNIAISQAKDEAIATAKSYTDEKIANLDLASNDEITRIDTEISGIKSELYDTTSEDGELEKGLISRVNDSETKIAKEIADREIAVAKALEDAKAYTDSKALIVEDLDMTSVVNKFKDALFGAAATTVDGEAL
jgi:chromosome segregation ATPase